MRRVCRHWSKACRSICRRATDHTLRHLSTDAGEAVSKSENPKMVSYERHEWLARRAEAAIDPDRPIIDPHHHLWDRNGSTYLAVELTADAAASHNITHTVFVECSSAYDESSTSELSPVGETKFVVQQAGEAKQLGGPHIAAIVGHADLLLGSAVEDVLAAHAVTGQGLFRGVRHGTNWSPYDSVKNGHHDPSQHLLADPTFREGVSKLGEMGFSFDAWLYFDQITELAGLARDVPECTMVLDHLGGPLGIGPHATARAEMAEVWRNGITDVATCESVVLKVGGLGMEHYFGTPWVEQAAPPSSEEVAAYWSDTVHFAIDAFGPSRCMFESNFPVDRQTLPYTVLWNAFQILASPYSATEQDELFFGTAARTYSIAV